MSLIITLLTSRGHPRTPADADELPTLANAAGTAGVIRQDTGAVVVANGTPFVRGGVGQYSYELTGVVAGVTYTAYRRLKLDGIQQISARDYTVSPLSALPSYLSVLAGDALAAGLPPLPKYAARDLAGRAGLLTLASLRIDASRRWQGRKFGPAQELEFPRVGCFGSLLASPPAVPTAVQLATLFEANSIADGERDRIAAAISAGLVGQSTGSVSEQYRQAMAGQASVQPLCDEAERLVARFRLTTGRLI